MLILKINHSPIAHYLKEYQKTPDYRFVYMYYTVLYLLSFNRLSPTSENTLKQLYNKTVRNSTDPYKKAVYCVLGRCELNNTHYQVLVKTEDYMWLKVSISYRCYWTRLILNVYVHVYVLF